MESGLSPAMPQQQPQLSPVGGARWMPAPDSGRRRQPSHDHHGQSAAPRLPPPRPPPRPSLTLCHACAFLPPDVPPPLPHQHTPRRALDFNHATDAAAMATPSPSQPPPAMTEARRRLVRDVYGSNTSPWATMPAAPSPAAYQPPAGAPAAAPLSLSSSAFTSSLPAPPQASPYDLPSPVMGGGGPPVKASFVKHGALAYDPNVQQTLMAKHQAALQQVSRHGASMLEALEGQRVLRLSVVRLLGVWGWCSGRRWRGRWRRSARPRSRCWPSRSRRRRSRCAISMDNQHHLLAPGAF